jgi:hypothetical protein
MSIGIRSAQFDDQRNEINFPFADLFVSRQYGVKVACRPFRNSAREGDADAEQARWPEPLDGVAAPVNSPFTICW